MGSITYFSDFQGVVKENSTACIHSDVSAFSLCIFLVFSLWLYVFTHLHSFDF